MRLTEECDDLVAFLPASHFPSSLDDLAGTIGAWDDRQLEWKRILSLFEALAL